jgi:hypothetical protein
MGNNALHPAANQMKGIIMRTRTLLGTAFAVVALSMPIAGITAGIADARPNTNGLAAECRASNGGTWVVDSSGGRVTAYMCYYKDIDGNGYVDYYDRYGNFSGTG